VAAFIAEPVVGATLGAQPATPGYFEEIREICDRHDVLFIADEVMTGFGRTGKRFGIDHWGVVPDLIACAKGLGGGYTPLGAVIVRPEIVGEVRRRRDRSWSAHVGRQPAICGNRAGGAAVHAGAASDGERGGGRAVLPGRAGADQEPARAAR
jgi:adenosylmethionine-8-amino-7-oxononanoate aminotransferase